MISHYVWINIVIEFMEHCCIWYKTDPVIMALMESNKSYTWSSQRVREKEFDYRNENKTWNWNWQTPFGIRRHCLLLCLCYQIVSKLWCNHNCHNCHDNIDKFPSPSLVIGFNPGYKFNAIYYWRYWLENMSTIRNCAAKNKIPPLFPDEI